MKKPTREDIIACLEAWKRQPRMMMPLMRNPALYAGQEMIKMLEWILYGKHRRNK